MSVDFIVEDGTSRNDSTSYASVDQFRQYWTNRGVDYSTLSIDVIQAKLNLATEYIDNSYRFAGHVSDSDQALEWPRYNVIGKRDLYIDNDVIPDKLISAVCYMSAQSDLQFVDDGITSESYGPVSTTYGRKYKIFTVVDNLLAEFLDRNRLVRVN